MDTKLADIMQDKLKFVERAGMKLQNILHRLNPWENVKCSRKGCLICSNPDNKTFSCNKPSISYKSYCLRCRQQQGKSDDDDNALPDVDEETDVTETKVPVQKTYWGESSKTAYWRGLQHTSDYFRKLENSHMWKHVSEAHPGEEPRDVKFGMSVVRQHFSAFSRQIFEAVLIFRAGDNVLNSKAEFNRSKVPRLSVMIGEGQHESFKKTNLDQEELEADIQLLKRRNPKLMDVQEAAPPPNKKLKRWQLSKQRKRDRERDDPGVGVEAPGTTSLDPPDPKHQGVQPSIGKHVTEGVKKDILSFPIFHFKANPAKPIEVKPKRIKKVKAEKGKKVTDDITKYFKKSADTTNLRPTEQTASQLTQSKLKQKKECDQAENS